MYLITGAKGQLGRELEKLLRNGQDAIFTSHADLDIADYDAVMEFVDNYDIDTIINCAAYTAVDKAQSDFTNAFKANVIGPTNLARTGRKIIHISTDYVFDGINHNRPYMPYDRPSPQSAYGQTKLAGEQNVLKYKSAEYVIIRTAWLYSEYGNNFVKTMRKLGAEKDSVGVIDDQIGTPTYAGDLAAAIVKIAKNMKSENNGIYHYTNEGVCSWYDFATAIMDMSGLKCDVRPIKTGEYKTAAFRPAYSVLDKTSIKKTFGLEIPHWTKSLAKCINNIKQKEM